MVRMRRSLVRFFARLGCIERLWGPCLFALFACSFSATAHAEPVKRVIVIDPGVPALSGRLLEEIEALGLDASLIGEGDPSESLEGSARRNGAIAAIRISGSETGAVEMTIVDRATGKTVSRRLAIATPSDPAAAELIATRTVELLRASLMELSASHPPRGEVRVTQPEIEKLTAPEPASMRLSLAIGPSVVKGSSFDLAAGVGMSISVLWKERLGVTGRFFLPVVAAELETSEGRIELRPSLYRVGGVVVIGERSSVFAGYLESGLLFGVLALSGAAESPFFGVHEDELVWGPWLGAGLRSSLTSKLGLVAGVDAAFTYPKTVIRSAGDEVTTFGRPVVSGMLGLEMTWP